MLDRHWTHNQSFGISFHIPGLRGLILLLKIFLSKYSPKRVTVSPMFVWSTRKTFDLIEAFWNPCLWERVRLARLSEAVSERSLRRRSWCFDPQICHREDPKKMPLNSRLNVGIEKHRSRRTSKVEFRIPSYGLGSMNSFRAECGVSPCGWAFGIHTRHGSTPLDCTRPLRTHVWNLRIITSL